MRLAALVALAVLGACATLAPDIPARCFVEDQTLARQIAAMAVGASVDDGSLVVEDQGSHWRVGRYAETHMEGAMIVSEDRGFTFDMDKCTGAMSGYRSWP